MRNREDFENLVFERAEKIKARDRAAKMIRLSVMPIAAAFLVLTAVGIHRFTTMPANLSDAAAPAEAAAQDADYAAPEYSPANAAKTISPREENETEGAEEDYRSYEAYQELPEDGEPATNAADEAPAGADAAESAHGSIKVTFSANGDITLTGEQANELAGALAGENTPAQSGESGYLGRITVEEDGTDTDYYLYTDHMRKTENGSSQGEFALSETTKALLEQTFPLRF